MKRPLAFRSENNLYAESGGEVKKASQSCAAGERPSGSKYLTTAGYRPAQSHTDKIGDFLKQCNYSYCQKPIAKNSTVFMYGDLGAFCSVECREYQIKVDIEASKLEQTKLQAKPRNN